MKKLYTVILVSVLLTSITAAHYYRTFNPRITVYKWPYKKTIAFTITCDDISSGYPLAYFEEIVAMVERYHVKATFFVIPHHGEWDLLTESPSFVNALHTAEENGHEIALHGYAHYQDEFVCQPEEQAHLLEKALSIMEQAGFTVKGFRAPCLKTTPETLSILKEYNFVYDSSIFGESGEPLFDTALPQIPSGHEYTWYLTDKDLPESLTLAKKEIDAKVKEGTVFSLVTHMKAVNEGEGMAFLEEFLAYTSEIAWNFTLLELVEWIQNRQNVTWEIRKTITGGEITFQNIPQGLVLEIGLPSHYHLKDPPPGIITTSELYEKTCTTEILFDQPFKEVTLSFALAYPSPDSTMKNELLLLCGSASNGDCDPDHAANLTTLFAAWEIPYRVADVNTEISADILKNSSLILIDSTFLGRNLTKSEKDFLKSLENRVIILSGVDLTFPFERFMRREIKDFTPLHSSQYDGWLDLGYYRIKVLQGKSTYITVEKLTQDPACGLYNNVLVQTLTVFSQTPVRQPFFSLEIDDCAMYETYNKGEKIVVNLQTYKNSLDLARSYGLTPIYGFTTSNFSHTPELDNIFDLLKTANCLVANHGYHHCLNFADPHVLLSELDRANTDIEAWWGSPPSVILVPCHEMHQESMVNALTGTSIRAVGSLDTGYTFSVFNGILFYERTSLHLSSVSVDDAPPFQGLLLYCRSLPPFVYAVTHIFNYCEKGSAYQYIADACSYFISRGYTPSDTETMAEEDLFWNYVEIESYTKDGLVVELSGLEKVPEKEYTVHFMVCGTPLITIKKSTTYCIESDTVCKDNITYVTLKLQPVKHTHK